MQTKSIELGIRKISEILQNYFAQPSIVWVIVMLFLLANIIRIILVVFVTSKKRKLESFYLKLLSIVMLIWTAGTLFDYAKPYLPENMAENPYLRYFVLYAGTIAMLFVPPLLCLHVWKQVSSKDLHWYINVLYFIPSVVYSGTIVWNVVQADGKVPEHLFIDSTFALIIRNIIFGLFMIKTYLMMFNVFYQMPPHMRKSTRHILVGVSFYVVGGMLRFWFPILPNFDFLLLGAHIMVDYLYASINIASANNVIVTSREFAFNSLSTMVIILSEKMNILDWNKKDNCTDYLLPKPKYKEPFMAYYDRIIAEGHGIVSPHDKNIISTTMEGKEGHYLITTHCVERRNRRFGYLVEIAEVTNIYTVFRYLEEIATKDQLTGLFNRNAYINKVKSIMGPDNLPLLIVVGDVNNLKPINDIYGHLEGDKLLINATTAIKNNMPQGAFVSRIGGDEFVMLVPNGTIEQVENFITKVNEECAASSIDERFKLSISWGYAILSNIEQDYNEVFDTADTMMYNKKKVHHRFHSSGTIPEPQIHSSKLANPTA